MSIAVQCPACRALVSLKRTACSCGKKLPTGGRTYYAILRSKACGKKTTRKLRSCRLHEAHIEAAFLLQSLKDEADMDGSPAGLTLSGLCKTYLTRLEIEGRSQTYQADTRRYLNQLAEGFEPDTLCEKITHPMIEQFRLSLRGSGLSPTSCDRALSAWRAAWNYSIPDSPNPFKRIKAYQAENRVTRYLTPEQRKKLLVASESLSRDLFEIILVAMTTGLRRRNVYELRRDQIEWETGLVSVVQKGGRPHTVRLPSVVLGVLSRIPEIGSPFLWLSAKTGRPYTLSWRRPWNKAKALAGIAPEFRFHDLRHDAATAIFEATGTLKIVQAVLGHSDPRMTDRYAHLLPHILSDAMEKTFPPEIVPQLSNSTEND